MEIVTDLIILAIVGVVFFLCARSIYRTKKSGGVNCGFGCEHCGGNCGSCGTGSHTHKCK